MRNGAVGQGTIVESSKGVELCGLVEKQFNNFVKQGQR